MLALALELLSEEGPRVSYYKFFLEASYREIYPQLEYNFMLFMNALSRCLGNLPDGALSNFLAQKSWSLGLLMQTSVAIGPEGTYLTLR